MILFPKQPRIYYIYAPDYTEKSAGVRTLHLLCHFLNEAGQKAFIMPMARGCDNPYLNAPHVTQHSFDWGSVQDSGLDYAVVYPDIVRGNPLGAKNVVRYLLAYAGAYGGDSEFPETDKVWSYTTRIASKTKSPENVLCMPVTDPNIYKPAGLLRSGACFYSKKYEMHGNKLLDITKDAKRLEGTQDEMVRLLQTSEVCYVYENTTVVVESQLCGCPVVLIRTPYFNELHSEEDFGMAGVRWSDNWGVADVGEALGRYIIVCQTFEKQLQRFIAETQT